MCLDLEGTTSTWPRSRLERWRSRSWSASRAGWKPGRWGWAGCRHTSGRWAESWPCCRYGSEKRQTDGAVIIHTPVSTSSQQSGCLSEPQEESYWHLCAKWFYLQVVILTAGVALHIKGIKEQGDGVVLWCLEDGGAVYVLRVDVRPARTLQVTKLLFICSATVWGK